MVIFVEFAGVRKLGLSKLKQDKIKGLGALKKSLRLKNLFGRFFHQHFEMLIKPLNVFTAPLIILKESNREHTQILSL